MMLNDFIDDIDNDIETKKLIQNEKYNSQIQELRKLIKQVSDNYGGDDEKFLSEYTEEVISTWSHDLTAAIECFKDLSKQHPPAKCRKNAGV